MRISIQISIFAALLVASPGTSAAEPLTFPPKVELAEIQQLVENCSPDHPRLLVTRNELARLPESITNDWYRSELAKVVIARAGQIMVEPPVTHKVIGRRLLQTSRRCLSRVLLLAMAWHLTGDNRFVDRCQTEMLAAARFNDWNPDHYLDVAEMVFALAIGYDWLFDELPEEARREIRLAIVSKGVSLQFADRDNWWITVGNNWGQVCHSGMLAGALAILEDEPELAARTIHSAIHNVVPSMNQYAPHGGYPEGPQYWSYGSTYNALLIANLESALGSDFGLSQAVGFRETGGFLALATGPSGQFFNYSDGGSKRKVEPILGWFANRYSRPEWLVGERKRWQELLASPAAENPQSLRFLPLALLWPVGAEADPSDKLPLNWSSGGQVPITVHRSSWHDQNATFVALKAGSPSASHGHMDCGSFVLDSDGVRWAIDLEPEDYHAIESRGMNLWDRGQNSDRWKILRLNNHGHNTLVINDQLQSSSANVQIVAFSENPAWSFSIVDLENAYHGQAKTARRGVALLPSREVVIRDELSGLQPGSRVRWGLVTRGEPTGLDSDRVVLNQENQTLTLAALAEPSAVWQAIDISKPKNEFDSPNPGTRLLILEATAPPTGELTITVLATPGSCLTPSTVGSVAIPLLNWPSPHD